MGGGDRPEDDGKRRGPATGPAAPERAGARPEPDKVTIRARIAEPFAADEALLPRLGRPARGRSGFGAVLDALMMRRGVRASRLAEALGVTPSYLSALVTGVKPVSPDRVEEIADSLGAEPEERAKLHRAAARDMGFRLDLPDDF
jgi:DNA-binding Xre family transcriptional regulator